MDNKYRSLIQNSIKDYDVDISEKNVRFGKSTLATDKNSFIVSAQHPKNKNSVIVWLTIHGKEAVSGLARKLPHYGKYSYLAFEGADPTNIAKGQWSTIKSPLIAQIPLEDNKQPETIFTTLPKRKALATLAPVFSAERMQEYVTYLASDELQGRAPGSEGIDKAANYIVEQFHQEYQYLIFYLFASMPLYRIMPLHPYKV